VKENFTNKVHSFSVIPQSVMALVTPQQQQEFDAILAAADLRDAAGQTTRRDFLARTFRSKESLLGMFRVGIVNDRILFDWPNNGFTDPEWLKLLHWCTAEQRKREALCVLL